MIAVVLAAGVLSQLPQLPALQPIRRTPSVTYLDRSGLVLGVRGGQVAPPVDLDRLPTFVPAAFVAIEDGVSTIIQGSTPLASRELW